MIPASAPKILLATFGTLGDIHPFIALAKAMQRRGLAPVLATSAMYRGLIEGEDVPFAPMRPDEPDIGATTGLDVAGVLKRMVRDPHFILDEIYLRFLAATFEDVSRLAAGADLVVAHSLLLGAQLAAEARGLPWLRVALAPIHLQSAMAPSLTRPLPYLLTPRSAAARHCNRFLRELLRRSLALKLRPYHAFRRRIGLPPTREDVYINCGRPSGAAAIVGLYAPHFAAPAPDHPPGTRILGFPVSRAAKVGLTPDLRHFLAGGAPPIVFTLGSFAIEGAGAFYGHSIAAARKRGLRALLLTGAREAARLAGAQSDDVHVAAYAPHDLVFPHAACIVHHGGMGTTAAALRAGKPQLVVPFFGDQPDHAARLVRLGVAMTLAPTAYTVPRATAALAALSGDGFRETAVVFAARIAEEDGAAAVADLAAALLARAAVRPDETHQP